MIVAGPPRAVVLECNRRCGSRFVRAVWDVERDRDACARAVWDANAAGWREMRGRGLRCAGCFERYGEGEKLMHTSLHDALAALFDLALKCHVCEEHVSTREGSDGRFGRWLVCDRDDCGAEIMCVACGGRDDVAPLDGWYCAQCGDKRPMRVPRSTAWRDLLHADSLRAANAAHEARR